MVKISILGLGVVGGGVADIIADNCKLIEAQVGQPVELKYILDIRDFTGHPLEKLVVRDIDTILADDEVSIVIEAMGGAHPAYDFSLKALQAGKNVVTSNKLVVAEFGAELLEVAKEKGVRYLFEASVGGGIPIIRPMLESLAGNDICEVCGILNGTTNYILTRMKRGGITFDAALKEAQDAGYAERDPSADVEGIDSCRKICILAGLAFGILPAPETVSAKGIRSVTLRDLADAEAAGCSLKLVGRACSSDEGKTISVAPCFVKGTNPLAGIEDVYNGILVRGNALGDVMFYGMGAGKLPTASAVVSDIIDIARGGSMTAHWTAAPEGSFTDGEDAVSEYCIRLPRKLDQAAIKEADGEYTYIVEVAGSMLAKDYPDVIAAYKMI
ncbi:MAG: homoserine dehydrogenase [Clostridia bacterium]|nr:homoserine dehydrogenase [Clostridia bacterium]